MLFDDGITTIEFFPTSYEMRAVDFTELIENSQREVIGAPDGGNAPRRERTIGLIRTTAERDALHSFLNGLDGAAFQFTDDVGRIWNARHPDDLESAEEDIAAGGAGWHRVTVRLFLASVASDAALEAYGNGDVSQMSIQKSGAAVLHFPLAYAPPLGRRDIATAFKELGRAVLHRDAARFTAKRMLSARYAGLPREFVRALEDYFVDTLAGAANPFSLAHFRDGTVSFRWTGGFAFGQDEGGRYSGTMELRQEV